MEEDIVVKVEGLGKKFCRNLRRSMYYGAADVLRSMVGMRTASSILRPEEFWAVDQVSFSLKKGETLGLIGVNGSGKSTLLRLLNGIYQPDTGRIEIKGKVGALIALGAGFHPLMTGRENIYLNGVILGMSKKEIDRKFDEIVEFADIGDFLDASVKTYSSGMYVRLGFAIAIQSNPDIMLVDEVLSVGDVSFQKKCFDKILDIKRNRTSFIFVSHSPSAVERLCNRAMLMKEGKMVFIGATRDCVQRYFYEIGRDNMEKGFIPQTVGIGDVVFSNVRVYQDGGEPDNPNIEFGKDFIIEFDYTFRKKSSDKNQVRIGIRTFEGRDVQKIFFQESPFIDNIVYSNEKIIHLKKEGNLKIKVLKPRLFPQTFRLDVAVTPLDMDIHLGGIANAALFNIIHPQDGRKYLEYGNMTVTEFDYDISVS